MTSSRSAADCINALTADDIARIIAPLTERTSALPLPRHGHMRHFSARAGVLVPLVRRNDEWYVVYMFNGESGGCSAVRGPIWPD